MQFIIQNSARGAKNMNRALDKRINKFKAATFYAKD